LRTMLSRRQLQGFVMRAANGPQCEEVEQDALV
jgi:hypothetical protein